MPVFKRRAVFEVARNLRLFFELRVGATRRPVEGDVADLEARIRELRQWLRKNREGLAQRGRQTEEVAEQLRKRSRRIDRLSERFGGYATFWLYCADRLIEDPPPEETVPYPLFGSYLWDEWATENLSGGEPQRVRSGPLSSIRATT